MPTFLPGWITVPHWRTRIVPGVTFCPPKRFTPRYWGFESRPLRFEPPPFLCSIARPLDLDAGHLDAQVALAMALLAAHVLPALEAHGDRLGSAEGAQDLAL